MNNKFSLIFILITLILIDNISAQSWDYNKLKSFFSKTKLLPVEGFYELDSDRKYIIGIIRNKDAFEIIYLFGSTANWEEGDSRGTLEVNNNNFIAKWDGSTKPGTLPLFNLPVILDAKGFVLKWHNDSPDYFRKIDLTEIDNIRRDYATLSSVQMIRSKSGIFEIPALLNNVLRIYLILDTGASDVSISPDVVLTLIKAKAIDNNDWLEGAYYKFADGSIAKSKRFIIRYLKIGDFEVRDVEASISNSIEAPLLLGQSALSKLGKIQIDYETKEFRIIK